jgi:RNA polymerase sigma-70 factor (ECF subfamily)
VTTSDADRRLLFEELVQRHVDLVYQMARTWTGDAIEAEDLTQEAFLRAHNAFERFEAGTNFKAWVLTILKNLIRDRHRASGRRPDEVSWDVVPAVAEPEIRESAPRALDLESKEVFFDLFDDEVTRVLRALPDGIRLALLLGDVEGLSYSEIAEVLDVPVGTVRSRIHRGRAALADRLHDFARSAGYLREVSSP